MKILEIFFRTFFHISSSILYHIPNFQTVNEVVDFKLLTTNRTPLKAGI